MLPIMYIFMSPIPTKSANLARGLRQSFHFQKITVTLKMNFFIAETSLVHQRTIDKNKYLKLKILIFLFIFKKWAKLFLTCTREK